MECIVCNSTLSDKVERSLHPFCSMRCKAVDLGKWLAEDYSISTPLFSENQMEKNENNGKEGAKNGNSDLLH